MGGQLVDDQGSGNEGTWYVYGGQPYWMVMFDALGTYDLAASQVFSNVPRKMHVTTAAGGHEAVLATGESSTPKRLFGFRRSRSGCIARTPLAVSRGLGHCGG